MICEKLREIFGQEAGVKDWWTPGKFGSVGKVNFHTNDHAWTFLRKYKGRQFSHGSKQLWHTWDPPKEEVLLSKRVSLAIKATENPKCICKSVAKRCMEGNQKTKLTVLFRTVGHTIEATLSERFGGFGNPYRLPAGTCATFTTADENTRAVEPPASPIRGYWPHPWPHPTKPRTPRSIPGLSHQCIPTLRMSPTQHTRCMIRTQRNLYFTEKRPTA